MKLFEKEVARAVRKKLEDEKKKKKEEDQTLLMKRYHIKVLFKLAFSNITNANTRNVLWLKVSSLNG